MLSLIVQAFGEPSRMNPDRICPFRGIGLPDYNPGVGGTSDKGQRVSVNRAGQGVS